MNFLTRILLSFVLVSSMGAPWQQLFAEEGEAPADTETSTSDAPQPDTADASSADEPTATDEAPSPEIATSQATKLPAQIHSGVLTKAELTDIAVSWVDLDTMLLLNQPTVDAGPVPEDALLLRSPADGSAFLVVTVDIKAKRTISRHDYGVEIEGELFPCLAITWGDHPYDVRRWQFNAAPDQVSLLFEIPGEAASFTLVPLLKTTVPQASLVAISLREDPADTSAAPSDDVDDGTVDPAETLDEVAEETPAEKKEEPIDEEGTSEAAEAVAVPLKQDTEKASSEPAKKEKKAPANEAGDWF